MNRVVVTGIGVVAPTGADTEDFFAGSLEGRTAVSSVPPEWSAFAALNSDIWAPLPEVPYDSNELSRVEQKQMDPVAKNAVHTAFRAVEAAGLRTVVADEKRRTFAIESADPARTGVYLGTGIAGIQTVSEALSHQILAPLSPHVSAEKQAALHYPKRFNPFTVAMLMPNAAAANVAIKLGITGPVLTYTQACASGNTAIGHCFRAIATGEIDMGLAGGSEHLYDAYGTVFRAFDAVKTLAHGYTPKEQANRPFDAARSGFLFSRGASAMLLLESESHARSRGALPIAEIAGFSESSDAHNIMMMDRSGAQIERMLKRLLQDTNTDAADIDYVNAHGTGTELNDAVESALIERIYRQDVRINSTKALTGHTIGASAALEAAVCALSLSRGKLHGMPNLENPMRPLNFLKTAEEATIDIAVSHSFAFGGHNTALLLKRYR